MTVVHGQPPRPDPGEALVRVHTVTLCGTDLHIFDDDYATELPIVQGHEISGIVENAPEESGFTPGDRVAVSPMRYCGTCRACRIGRMNACRSSSCLGCYEDGGLAELITVPAGDLHRVPAGLDLDLAALAEPTSIAVQAVLRGRPQPGESALVLGCGPIGLLATLHLTSLGVQVTCADVSAERAAFATRFGAARTALAGRDPIPDEPSLVIEATGSPAALDTALQAVSTAGRVVLVGLSGKTANLPVRTIPVKDLDVLGSRNSQRRMDEALALLHENTGAARDLITHRVPLADIGTAFRLLRAPDGLVGKVAVDLTAEEEPS
ncbi:alcohol dehydrogenase catalytic domain-containing protein [Saccharopolyspora montiporae]|uniref:alcohol dehydrogenase catalytic domain-containing protein n=1 Tax=Saccharopolyspora montiporae TaxID=2781240 RepID=UPI00187F19D5